MRIEQLTKNNTFDFLQKIIIEYSIIKNKYNITIKTDTD